MLFKGTAGTVFLLIDWAHRRSACILSLLLRLFLFRFGSTVDNKMTWICGCALTERMCHFLCHWWLKLWIAFFSFSFYFIQEIWADVKLSFFVRRLYCSLQGLLILGKVYFAFWVTVAIVLSCCVLVALCDGDVFVFIPPGLSLHASTRWSLFRLASPQAWGR